MRSIEWLCCQGPWLTLRTFNDFIFYILHCLIRSW